MCALAFLSGCREARRWCLHAACPALNTHTLLRPAALAPAPRSKQILRGASFKIRRGEAVGIIGSSGTGKSTTLRLAAGLLQPDRVRLGCLGLAVCISWRCWWLVRAARRAAADRACSALAAPADGRPPTAARCPRSGLGGREADLLLTGLAALLLPLWLPLLPCRERSSSRASRGGGSSPMTTPATS